MTDFANVLLGALGNLMSNGLLAASWWQIALITFVATHITIASVTIYLHRHQAHRSLELHPFVSHLFRLWLWMSTGQVTKEWASIHRKHHAKCEKEGDPHSPVIFGIKKVFWEGAELYRAESKNPETMAKYGHGAPNDWIEKNLYTRFSWQGVGLMLIIDVALFGALGLTVWAIQMAWIPVTAAGVINGIGHHAGYRNFESADNSRNILPWGILIGGEELHNNHHTYPTSAKLSVKPHEFDIGWAYINALQFLGLATVKKSIPRLQMEEESSQGASIAVNKGTLDALITHRFEVMARYAEGVQAAVKLETKKAKLENRWDDGYKLAKKWLHRDPTKIPSTVEAKLANIQQSNATLNQWLVMREELHAVWTKTNASADQLVADLQAWCKKAENSGVASLAAFALQIRRFKASPV